MPPRAVQALGYADAALNITTDILFAVAIPAPLLWGLNASRRTRASLVGLLGLGALACAASVAKAVFLYNLGDDADWLWDSRDITVWSVVELNMGIAAGSLPAVSPLLRRALGLGGGGGNGSGAGCGGGKTRGGFGKGSQLGGSSFASRRGVWFNISGVQRPELGDAAEETGSERTLDASVRGQGGSGPGSYELGYMGHENNIMTTSVVTSDVNTRDGSVDGAGIEHGGIRKTKTMTVTFEVTARSN